MYEFWTIESDFRSIELDSECLSYIFKRFDGSVQCKTLHYNNQSKNYRAILKADGSIICVFHEKSDDLERFCTRDFIFFTFLYFFCSSGNPLEINMIFKKIKKVC